MKVMYPQRGAALILTLLLIAVSGLLAAGWITFLTARSGYVETISAAIQRRIALENSKALAQQFMLERVLPSVSGGEFAYDVTPSGWGGIYVHGWGGAPMVSVQKAAGYNPFNPGNGDGFASFALTFVLRNGADNPTRTYHIKSRSPLLSGTLLCSQTPLAGLPSPIGGIAVNGSAMVWRPDLSMTFLADALFAPPGAAAGAYMNAAGGGLGLNQLAFPVQVANPSANAFYGGQFDAISNANPAANSSHTKAQDSADGAIIVDGEVEMSSNGIVCDGLGNVTITTETLELGNVYIPGKITSLTLDGQPLAGDAIADDRKAILIVVDQPVIDPTNPLLPANRDLATVILDKHNNRRVALAIKKRDGAMATISVVLPTAGAAWRLLLEAEGAPMSISSTGSAVLQGGIRSDRGVALAGGNVALTKEYDGKYLERLATRNAWVESLAQ